MESMAVLVIDDEPGIGLGIARALRGFVVEVTDLDTSVQFEVLQAETAEDGLEIIMEQRPSIILLDNKLPGMSGLEALDHIAKLDVELYVIFITAYASIETAVRATKHGASDFLPKPFTPTDLKNAVRKAATQRVVSRRAKEFAEERRRVRFEFISILAHELRAPLTAVEDYLRCLDACPDGEAPTLLHEYVQRCLVRTEYMKKMIADLLALTQIESGQREREIADRDVGEVIRAALATAAPETAARGITTELHVEGPVTLQADHAELEIILGNLISNAVKYNKDNGRIDAAALRDGDRVVIRVSDTGIGMDEEESARLFKDFVRIENEKTKDILGSGLGLSTVKKLALVYGGDITVESEPDKGSTFTVVLRDAKPGETYLE